MFPSIKKYPILAWLFGIMLAEAVSRMVVFHPLENSVLTILIGAVFFVVALLRPGVALGVLSIEYLIGSKGYLFHIGSDPENHGGVSIRILFFGLFFSAWVILQVWNGSWREVDWKSLLRTRWVYALIGLMWLWGVVRGWMLHQPFVLTDAQPWLAWLLLLPVIDLVVRQPSEIRRDWLPAVIAGLIWLPIETLGLLYFFTHHFDPNAAAGVYLWVRRTGVGEITPTAGSLYRVFIQSQVYAAGALVAAAVWLLKRPERPLLAFVIFSLSCAELVASLSRSFWMGTAAGLCVCAIIVLRRKAVTLQETMRGTKYALLGVAVGIGLVYLAANVPIPHRGGGDLARLVSSRTDVEDLAGVSRWNLLPAMWNKVREHPLLGSGFGTTVAYQSRDPRITKDHPDGWYAAHAFEWGWLTFWLQLGLFGLLAMGLLIADMLSRVWRSALPFEDRVAIMGGLVALSVIHLTTPYLNHPLGIFFLVVIEGVLVSSQALTPRKKSAPVMAVLPSG